MTLRHVPDAHRAISMLRAMAERGRAGDGPTAGARGARIGSTSDHADVVQLSCRRPPSPSPKSAV